MGRPRLFKKTQWKEGAYSRGGAYWKEGAYSNHYGTFILEILTNQIESTAHKLESRNVNNALFLYARTAHYTCFSIILVAIGTAEFDEMFSESVDNSDSDLDFSDISSVSSDQSDVENDANEAPREEQIWIESSAKEALYWRDFRGTEG